jgi:DNA-binding MarR family transcriptional regulator
MNEGVTIYEISKKLLMSSGAASRNTKMLSEYMESKPGKSDVKKGYNLIQTRPDLHERRRLALFLTSKGKRVKKELERILVEGDPTSPHFKDSEAIRKLERSRRQIEEFLKDKASKSFIARRLRYRGPR